MPDAVTATKTGTTEATPVATNNNDKVNALLDEARDLLVEDGMDPASADAFTNFARPGSPSIVGNLADLQRMGAIAVTGEMPTPPGQDNLTTSDINDAFVAPPEAGPTEAAKDMTQISADAAEAEEEDVEPPPETETAETGSYEDMTVAELQAELDTRGVEYSSGDRKADLIEKLS